MERDDAAGHEPPGDVGEAGALHRGAELFGGSSESGARSREGTCGRRPARQDAAEQRHDAVEPEAEERSQDAAGLGDLEAAEPPIGPEDAEELAEAVLELGHVPDPEPDRDDVEAPVLEGERGQVAVHPPDLARLPARPRQHLVGEVQPGHVAAHRTRRAPDVCPAGGVQHAVTGPDDRLGRDGATGRPARRS